MTVNIIEIDGVSHAFDGTGVLSAVSFEVGPGEIVSVLGASGLARQHC